MSEQSDAIFARIARRYDLINRILSLGRDQAWRGRGVSQLPGGVVLDLGSGTGTAAPLFGPRQAVALDPVREMLALSPMELRVAAIGEAMPFADGCFDGVFSAFVFRNLGSIPDTLTEIERILRPGGAAVIVDLGRPRNRWAAMLHRAGSAVVLPLAGMLARAPRDYWYLHRSLDRLPPAEALYAGCPLVFEQVWRMGPLGFVYGVVLRKRPLGDGAGTSAAEDRAPGSVRPPG